MARKLENVGLLGLLGLCLLAFVGRIGADDRDYSVGVARIDITPDYPVRLNGFGGRRDEAEGVSQRLWAKAIAISSAPTDPPLVLIAIDNLGIPKSMTDEIAVALVKKYNLPRANIALTFSHTHCAPKVNGASDTIFSSPIPPNHQEHIDRYSRELPEMLIKMASEAIDNRQPATLEWNVGKVEFAQNRRTAGGPVDHDLPMLVVRGADGNPRAIYVSYACHCVTLSFNQYSGDWAGYAQELIERQFPGAVALVSIGCGSDSNPVSGVTGDNVVSAADQGQQISNEVTRLIKMQNRTIRGIPVARLDHIDLPLNELPTKVQLETMASQGGAVGYNAEWQLARLKRGEPLVAALDYPIQSFTFGDDLHLVFLAGEVCVDYSLRLKRELHRDRVWINGYSNDFCAYIPSERLLKEGGYGGGGEIPYFALPTALKTGLEEKIIGAVVQQTPQQFHAVPGTQGIPPKSADDSLQCMMTHPELKIELVAAEPLVADPVAIDFGSDGCLWVAEMADYSREVDEQFVPMGRVRRLTDVDRDGQFDQSTEFLTGLRFPTDVKTWRDGVIVCDAPDIIFAADRDGDGRAEFREVLLTGFATHNPHARANSLKLGLDGWMHGSGGLFGGLIRNQSGKVVDVSNQDFRFHPDTGEIEPATGATQQGRPRDDFDNWFGCTNSDLLMHFPIDERYAGRNPNVAPPRVIVSVPDAAHGQQLFPPRGLVLFKLSGAPGRPTSACGAEIYRDVVLGQEYYGNAFVCEPVNQLVHRLVLERNGSTFTGRRAASESQSEFLTSTDQWFRPVQARTGPDGALYVVDMYRYVIEHSRWIPPESRAELNLLAGEGMGRIYRVVPRESPISPLPQLGALSDVQLATAMDSANGPTRDMGQQILIERASMKPETIERLLETARNSDFPAARVQAAATLALQNKLKSTDLLPLLQHESFEVRRCALRIGEILPPGSDDFAVAALNLTSDPVQVVRTQAAFTVGELAHVDSSQAFANILLSTEDNSDESFAVLSSLTNRNALAVWTKVIAHPDSGKHLHIIRQLTRLTVDFVDGIQLEKMLDELLSVFAGKGEAVRWSVLAEWMQAANRRGAESVKNKFSTELRDRFATETEAARQALQSTDSKDSIRIGAIKLVASLNGEFVQSIGVTMSLEDRELLQAQLASRLSPAVQSIALGELSRIVPGDDASVLLGHWEEATPGLRRQMLDLLLGREAWTTQLLESMKAGLVSAGDLDASQRERLLTHEQDEIRQLAEHSLAMSLTSDRESAVSDWQAALALTGDFERGRQVFSKHCAACHKLDGFGHDIGPDLAALSNRTPNTLLVAIIDPNRDIDGRYLNYVAITTDGLTVSGLLASESGASVTLKEREGKTHVLLRNQIDDLRATKKSAMPEGIEKDLTHQDVADVVAYMGPGRLPPKTFVGNQPAVIKPNADGEIVLTASSAEIYGEVIVYETDSPYQNIGYWQGDQDSAAWRFEVVQPGKFDVYFDYACEPSTAGNRFSVRVHNLELAGIVESTGAWSKYQWLPAGTIELPAGPAYLAVGIEQPKRAAVLFDLRQIKLLPSGTKPPVVDK